MFEFPKGFPGSNRHEMRPKPLANAGALAPSKTTPPVPTPPVLTAPASFDYDPCSGRHVSRKSSAFRNDATAISRVISNVTSGTASFVPRGVTAPQMISFDFGSGTASGGSGLDGLTQYAATSAISFIGEQSM